MGEKKKEQRYHNGIAVDSDEEVLALMWLEELMERGLILKIERASTFDLSPEVHNRYTETVQLKTKEKIVEKAQKLLHAHEYTPEFKVTWSHMAMGTDLLWNPGEGRKFEQIFIQTIDAATLDPISYLEVKPDYDQNNMTRLFRINQKWMFDRHRIFVNLVQPHTLCKETFTPVKWMITSTGKRRTIHWDIRTVEEYLNGLNIQL